MSTSFEIQLIAIIIATACSLPGVFLVLRRMSMMSDSITHTILLGIVLAFFITQDLSSPLLIVGAAAIGLVTVWVTELVNKTKLVSEDSAVGIVFPLLFSIAIILITRYAGSVHLDTDSVLLGELAFAPFDRLVVFGIDIGAKSIYTSGILLLINAAFVIIFFKELKAVTFDSTQAALMGFSPVFIHYGLMSLVSLTAVGAFEAVGSVLVVAFMIGPPVCAYLLTDNLKSMLIISAAIGACCGIAGFRFSMLLDISIAGSIATMVGIAFLLVFIFAPDRGLINTLIKRKRQKSEFAEKNLLLHLCGSGNDNSGFIEYTVSELQNQLCWDNKSIERILNRLLKSGYINYADESVKLTESGMENVKTIENEL